MIGIRPTLIRYATALGVSFGITGVLLYVMTLAIHTDDVNIGEPKPPLPTDFVRLKEPPELEPPENNIEPPPEVEQEPPRPEMNISSDFDGGGGGLVFAGPQATPGPIDPHAAVGDGDPLPIMAVAPEYPERPKRQGLEGWVIVEFVIDQLGRVQEPRVVEAQPLRVFDRAALNAVKRYKYKPRVLNGAAVPVSGVRKLFTFELN